MTPDLTTPEGRAELRALIAKAQPGPWFLEKQRGYCDTYVKTAHPDWAPTEKGPHKNFIAEFGLGNEPAGRFFYDQNAEMVCAAVNGLTALLDAIDAETERSAALAREISALRSDLDDALVSVIKNQCRIDDLEATIERLTAPVTEEEGFDVVSLLGRGWSPDHVLDAFLARRKEPAP